MCIVFFIVVVMPKKSSVGYIDLDIVTQQVVTVHPQPVFAYGPQGAIMRLD
jgi:hypothetical protein